MAGMGTTKGIYKRGNVWWICYADADGKTQFESSKSSSYKDAESLLVKRRYEVQNDLPTKSQSPPDKPDCLNTNLQELAEKYETHCKHQKAFKAKKNVLKHVVKEIGGHTILCTLTTLQIEEYQALLAGKGAIQINSEPAHGSFAAHGQEGG